MTPAGPQPLPWRRIFVDVSYTRVQSGAVGITRTARRLVDALTAMQGSAGCTVQPVAFDGRAFRAAPPLAESGVAAPARSGAALALATGVAKPAIEQLLRLPWPLVSPLWERAAGGAFARAAAGLAPVQFAPGDLLLLFDASWNYPVWRGARHARAHGAKVVPLVHDLMPLQAPQFCVPWVRSAFGHWLGQMVTCSDALMCNSASTRAELVRHAAARGWRLPPTSHLRLGCDAASSPGGAVREELRRFFAGGRTFATVGSIEPKKNHAALFEAVQALWRQGQAVPLAVVGRRTPECAALIARMARSAAQGQPLLLLHDATDAEIDFVYRHSLALVLPSLFEGFGLPLVEARTLGCPVLANDLPAFRELADEGVRLFDAGDAPALAALLLQQWRGQALLPRSRMPAFSWHDSAAQCLQRLAELLPAQPSPAAQAPSPNPHAPAGRPA